MLHIVNYSHRTVQLSDDVSIPPKSVQDLDIGYTDKMVNLCRAGIIKVTNSQECNCGEDIHSETCSKYASRIQAAMANGASSSN